MARSKSKSKSKLRLRQLKSAPASTAPAPKSAPLAPPLVLPHPTLPEPPADAVPDTDSLATDFETGLTDLGTTVTEEMPTPQIASEVQSEQESFPAEAPVSDCAASEIANETSASLENRIVARFESLSTLLEQQIEGQSRQLAELQLQQQDHRSATVALAAAETRLALRAETVAGRSRQLRRIAKRLKALRNRTVEQRSRLAARFRERLNHSVSRSTFERLQQAAFDSASQIEALSLQLAEAVQQVAELHGCLEEKAISQESLEREINELQLRGSIDRETISVLESLVQGLEDSNESTGRAHEDHDSELYEALASSQNECHELRLQLEDMAAKLAKVNVRRADSSGSLTSESLSWEQRKALMMVRLEEEEVEAEEGMEDSESSREERQSLLVLIQKTDHEIKKRDAEIVELRQLLEEQANARGGIAVGAAAFAQMFDADELICEERERLRQMQQEWEEKLRKAEIELSLERARLARERSQVEQDAEELRRKMREIEVQEAQQLQEHGKPKPVRRWLAQLGLGDEK